MNNMQDIEFDADKKRHTEILYSPTSKGGFIIKFLKNIGITDSTTINVILLGLSGILFGLTIFIYAGTLGGNKRDLPAESRALLILSGTQR